MIKECDIGKHEYTKTGSDKIILISWGHKKEINQH